MNIKILIVDDDQYTRSLLGRILVGDKLTAPLKPTIIEAANGLLALEAYEKHKPQLAIIDLFMPKMDGFEVCTKLRELAGPDALTLAVMSGVYKDSSIAPKLMKEHGASFFAKPYQLKNIAAFVAQSLAPAKAAAPSLKSGTHAKKPVLTTSGTLDSKHSAARIFWDLMEREATGRLVMRSAQVVRQIELFVGHPVKVTTNVREETLGNFLVMRKCIDKNTQRKAMSLAASKNVRLGEAFLEMGVLTPQSLIDELTAQTKYKLTQALRWTTGSWTFREGEPKNSRSDALDFAKLIVCGLAEGTRIQSPSPAIANLSQRPLVPNARGTELLREISTHVSEHFSSQLYPGVTMDDMLSSGVSRAHLFRGLDILQVCGGLDVGTISTSTPLDAPGVDNSRLNLRDLASTNAAAQPAASLYSGLFEDESSVGRSGSFPLKKLGSEQLWNSDDDVDDTDDVAQGGVPLDLFASTELAPAPQKTPPLPSAPSAEPILSAKGSNQDFEEDSVVNVSFSSIGPSDELVTLKQRLLQEYLRIHEQSYYDILAIGAQASPKEISDAYVDKLDKFPRDMFSAEKLGRDYAKLGIVLDAYQQARRVLLDVSERQRYDDTIHGTTQDLPNAPSMDADIAFQEAEQLLAEGKSAEAIKRFEEAIKISPAEHAYHASLGWAIFVQLGKDAAAASQAHPHIEKALDMAPDSALVHEYMGLLHATLGDDNEAAVRHLTRALDTDPRRPLALTTLERLHLASGSHDPLDQLYRRMLVRMGDDSGDEASILWQRIGALQQHYRNDPNEALVAYREALKRCPQNEELLKLCQELSHSNPEPFLESCSSLVATWKARPTDFAPLQTMYALAESANHHDAQFLAATALESVGASSDATSSNYNQFKPRFLLRAQTGLGRKEWEALLHDKDFSLLGRMYALLHDVIQAQNPIAGAQKEVSEANEVEGRALSAEFRTTQKYVARVLGVAQPKTFVRGDYGHDMQVGALPTPVLLVGPDALASTNKIELAYRLGKAMSFLRPGRATVASCRSRVLKSAMMACYSLRAPGTNIPDPNGSVRDFRKAIQELEPKTQGRLLALVAGISQEYPNLNLSRWTRALSLTANRCGLLLCGDLGIALHCLGEPIASETATELIAFSLSPNYMRLRSAMALSIEV